MYTCAVKRHTVAYSVVNKSYVLTKTETENVYAFVPEGVKGGRGRKGCLYNGVLYVKTCF